MPKYFWQKLNTTFFVLCFGASSTDSLSWTSTEETIEKKWAGAIGIPLHCGGQLLSDGGAGTGVDAAPVEGDGRRE